MHATVRHLHRSDQGMPKLPVSSIDVQVEGIVGDIQRDRRYHGGPQRAVCIFSSEVIDQLRDAGHPITPGATGENVTLGGVDWSALGPGTTLTFDGGVVLEVTSDAPPCPTIEAAFTDGAFKTIAEKEHPGRSRLYCKVITTGTIAVGERVAISTAARA